MAARGPVALPALHFRSRTRIGRLIIVQPIAHVVDQQALGIHQPEAGGSHLLSGQALPHHRVADLIGDSHAGRSSAQDHHALVPHRRSANAHR